MKYLCGVLVLALSVVAQTGGMPECGRGRDKAHPCFCTLHVEEVQAQHMRDCVTGDHGESVKACMGKMPEHCSVIEHYGRWEVGEDGEHVNPMPNQCTKACTRSHCLCGDGHKVCHLAHDPNDDKIKK